MRMPVRLLRQIFSVLLVVAYVSATIVAVAPAAQRRAAWPMAGGMTMMHGRRHGRHDADARAKA